MQNKILYSDNGVLSDLTTVLQDYYAGTAALTIVAAEDALYLGSRFPFTKKYLSISTPSVIASVLSISYWDGNQWRAAVETIDETAVGGKTFAASGAVSFTPDKRYGWAQSDTTDNGTEKVTGFGTTTIYDMFWLKLTFSGATAATLAWYGDLFCTDNDLAAEYPDLSRSVVKTAFAAGKTTWEEQRVVASELITNDLKRLGITASPGKLLTAEQMRRPAVSKTAEVIFSVLEGFQDSAKSACLEYAKRMDPRAFDIDSNENGLEDAAERQVTVHRMSR